MVSNMEGQDALSRPPFALTILSDADSWLNTYLPSFIDELRAAGHQVRWAHTPEHLPTGDFAFILSCGHLIRPAELKRHRHNLVVHESALPQGKGWSPLTWQILEGKNEISVTLFEAAESVDSGRIYLQEHLRFDGTELVADLRARQAATTLTLCRAFLATYPDVVASGREQKGDSTYYPRRRPQDSRLDPTKTLAEQFNLLRVVDNERYPAFFELNGATYVLKIERVPGGEGP